MSRQWDGQLCSIGAILVVSIGAACSDGGERPGASFVESREDSAGVQIVSTGVTRETPSWRLSPEPAVRLGLAEGDEPYLFTAIIYAGQLSDGRIVVANGYRPELRFFDSSGRFLYSAGRAGAGPGDFQVFAHISTLPGDTLLVHDDLNERLTLVAPDGSIGEPIRWQRPISGALVNGRVALFLRDPAVLRPSPGDTVRYIQHVVLGETRSTALDTLATIPGPLRGTFLITGIGPGGGGSMIDLPAAPLSHTVLLSARRDQIVVSRTDEYELRVFDSFGELKRIIRRIDLPREIIDDAVMSKYLAGAVDPPGRLSVAPPSMVAEYNALVKMLAGAPMPTHSAILIDEEDNIWVRGTEAPWQPQRSDSYVIFGPDGSAVATAELPLELRVFHIGSDHIVGVEVDDLGVERVLVYELLKH